MNAKTQSGVVRAREQRGTYRRSFYRPNMIYSTKRKLLVGPISFFDKCIDVYRSNYMMACCFTLV